MKKYFTKASIIAILIMIAIFLLIRYVSPLKEMFDHFETKDISDNYTELIDEIKSYDGNIEKIKVTQGGSSNIISFSIYLPKEHIDSYRPDTEKSKYKKELMYSKREWINEQYNTHEMSIGIEFVTSPWGRSMYAYIYSFYHDDWSFNEYEADRARGFQE